MNVHFFDYIVTNNTGNVLELIRQDPSLVNERNQRGYTGLMLAAGRGDEELVSILLENGADVHLVDPHEGTSALHVAALGGNSSVASLLVKAGAQINLQAPSNSMTPLMNAVWHQHPEMVRFFLDLERINIDLKNVLNLTAEEMIGIGEVSSESKSVADAKLMRQYFDSLKTKRAAVNVSHELIAVLANYDQKLSDKEIAEKVKTLISQGADVNTREYNDNQGNDFHTPLLIAARDGRAATVKQLLAAHADITLTDEYMKANAAHKAAYFGHAEVLKLLAAHPDFNKIKNAQGPYNGYTPLHDAVWHNHLEAVKVLLEADVDSDLRGLDGLTPLEMAKKYGYVDIVKLLDHHR